MGSVRLLMLMNAGLRDLGKILFWASLIMSQIAGLVIGRKLPGHLAAQSLFYNHHQFVTLLIFQILAAVLFFAVFYCFFALKVVSNFENRTGVKINKPSLELGIICSAIIPLILCAMGFLLILCLSGLSIKGSA
jgi:hypothetical protein